MLHAKKLLLEKARLNQEQTAKRLENIDSLNTSLKAKAEQLDGILKKEEARFKQVVRLFNVPRAELRCIETGELVRG